jgi:transcriptional regulator with XRE-family HTH domain
MTGAELRTALAALGLSQVEVASQLDVAPNTVYRWTAGKWPVPAAVGLYLLQCLRTQELERELAACWTLLDRERRTVENRGAASL